MTAVGHEQDTPLCDLAADRRASTPTAAGRLVVPDLEELLAGLAALARRARSRDATTAGAANAQGLDQRHERLRRAPALMVERHRARLAQAGGRLRTLSPKATLERGYAIVRREGELVRSSGAVVPGDPIAVEVADGSFGARVE